MKKQFFITIIFTFCTLQSLYSHHVLTLSPEIGLSRSGNIHYTAYETLGYQMKSKSVPNNAVLIGVILQSDFAKKIALNTGLQYSKSGVKFNFHEEGVNIKNNLAFTDDVEETQHFYKLSLPLTIGYKLLKRKVKFSVNGGINVSYILIGRYSEKTQTTIAGATAFTSESGSLNIFNPASFEVTAKRWNTSFISSLDLGVTKKLNLNFTFTVNPIVKYASNNGQSLIFKYYSKNDISITLRYILIVL
jgi:hypothetical protein